MINGSVSGDIGRVRAGGNDMTNASRDSARVSAPVSAPLSQLVSQAL